MTDRVETSKMNRLSASWWTGVNSGNPVNGIDSVIAIMRVASDVVAFTLSVSFALLLASFIEPSVGGGALRAATAAGVAETFGPAAVLAGYFAVHGHYTRRLPFWSELRQILIGSAFALLLNTSLGFLLDGGPSRVLFVATWVMLPIALVSMRHLVRAGLDRTGLWRIPTLLVGDGETARATIMALTSETGLGYEFVGQIGLAAMATRSGSPSWRAMLKQYKARLVVVAVDHEGRPNRSIVDALVREAVPFAIVPPSDGLPVVDCERTYFFSHDTVLLSYRNNLLEPVARLAKIAFDLAAAVVLLLILLPVLVAIAVAVKLDGGPVFYSHKRIGAGGKTFGCMKFRSMCVNGDQVLRELLARDPAAEAEWVTTQKLRNDPRVTRVGKILRKTSLDELPQLFNVLRLEMSLVGPRPIVEKEVHHYGDALAYYMEARPGLTGLWQVSGRSDTTYAERVHLDTWYVKNWTLWHDIAILAKTIPAVLQRRGAV